MNQIAQAVISFEGDLSERIEMIMVHDYTDECIFDLCLTYSKGNYDQLKNKAIYFFVD